MQLCRSLNILWHCLSLGLEWKLTFSSPVATVEFSKFAGILSGVLSQHHLLGLELLTWIWSPLLALFLVMLLKTHLTSHSRMSGSRWVTIWLWLSWSWTDDQIFLYSSSLYSYHLFLISSASVRSMSFLSLTEPIFTWNIPLVSLIFLKRSLVFPILLFPLFLCTDHWGRLSYLSWLLFGILCSNGYIFSLLLYFSLLFLLQLFVSPPQTAILLFFLHFFFLVTVLITASCTMSWTSVHSSLDTLSLRCNPLNLFLTSTV